MDIITKGVNSLLLSTGDSERTPPLTRTPSVTSSVHTDDGGLSALSTMTAMTPMVAADKQATESIPIATKANSSRIPPVLDNLPSPQAIPVHSVSTPHFLGCSVDIAPLSPVPRHLLHNKSPGARPTSSLSSPNAYPNMLPPSEEDDEPGNDYFSMQHNLIKTTTVHEHPDTTHGASAGPSSPLASESPRISLPPLINSAKKTPHFAKGLSKRRLVSFFSRRKQHKKHRKLCLNDFVLKRTVGMGACGRVHLAQSKHNKKHYAVKTLDKYHVVRKNQVKHINNEFSILRDLSHPFLVNLWDAFQDPNHLYMVMDYVPGGELFRILRKNKHFTEANTRFYAAEVILALEYLHEYDIIYRDLKPENILLDSKGHIKLTDFGFAKHVESHTYTVVGTPDYIAPEVIKSNGYTKSVDWWCLGILIYEMYVGKTPFADKNPVKMYEKILTCDVPWPADMNPVLKDLLMGLLTPEPADRYGLHKDIKSHPWFASIDFDLIYQRKYIPPHIPRLKKDGDATNFATYKEPEHPYGKHYVAAADPYKSMFPAF
ncbi:kinase-like domain-containing protein [Gongronella butleri]|nr:kinase-like domain-containing protein [Gongronella butleri]